MEEAIGRIESTLDYAGFRPATLNDVIQGSRPQSGWFRRGVSGVFVFVSICIAPPEGLIAELYDSDGKCVIRKNCENARHAAETAEGLLHLGVDS